MHCLCRHGTLVLTLALAGCGSSVSDPGEIELTESSLLLTFTDVADPGISSYGSPSLEDPFRLDFQQASDGWTAVLTARWGVPAAYTVEVEQTQVTLSGAGRVGSRGYGYATDEWSTIVLRGGSDGQAASFTATGSQEVWFGDYGENGELSGSGTIGADTTAPEVEASPARLFSGPTELLPWDGVRLRAAEGIEPDGLLEGLSVTHAGGESAVDWELSPDDAALSWAGATMAAGRWPWLEVADGAELTLRAADYQDRSGNVGPPHELPMTLLGLPLAQPSYPFDADGMLLSWGAVTRLEGSPDCEQGGCLRFGPSEMNMCEAQLIGVAGRLAAPSASAVRVRHRVVLHDAQTPVMVEPGRIWLVSADGTTNDAMIRVLATDLTADGADWTSDWQDTDVDASALTGPTIGVAVHVGDTLTGCGDGYPVPYDRVTLLLEGIDVVP